MSYRSTRTGTEVDELLTEVDEKTIYDVASTTEHGLMSSADKKKLDGLEIEAITNSELEEILT